MEQHCACAQERRGRRVSRARFEKALFCGLTLCTAKGAAGRVSRLPDALLFSGQEDTSLSVWNLCSTKLNGGT